MLSAVISLFVEPLAAFPIASLLIILANLDHEHGQLVWSCFFCANWCPPCLPWAFIFSGHIVATLLPLTSNYFVQLLSLTLSHFFAFHSLWGVMEHFFLEWWCVFLARRSQRVNFHSCPHSTTLHKARVFKIRMIATTQHIRSCHQWNQKGNNFEAFKNSQNHQQMLCVCFGFQFHKVWKQNPLLMKTINSIWFFPAKPFQSSKNEQKPIGRQHSI